MKLHNTASRKLESFKPLKAKTVKLYTCGPTVYGQLHIGNWVSYIRWDTLVRLLTFHGYDVKRVLNITDVGHLVSDADEGEDKLEKGARSEGTNAWEVAKKYTADFQKGIKQLNLMQPTIIPKATDHIPQQIEFIKKLEDKGCTYIIDDGVYFDISKFPNYADFAHLDLKGERTGARVQNNPQKRQPQDFALWKFSPKGKKRDMEWDSPWGKGFPGWHIECSALALEYLGEKIDIHTGGIDHIPIHHTNEIAQSESLTGKVFARYWLHNNFLMVNGAKIAKSLGNGITLDDLADKGYSPMDFKMFVSQSHYRSESNFSWDNLKAAKARLHELMNFADLRWQHLKGEVNLDLKNAQKEIADALDDDLNTPKALSVLSRLTGQALEGHLPKKSELEEFLDFLENLFGFNLLASPDITQLQKELIGKREEARRLKDWHQADAIRQKLDEQGIAINDLALGPIWLRK